MAVVDRAGQDLGAQPLGDLARRPVDIPPASTERPVDVHSMVRKFDADAVGAALLGVVLLEGLADPAGTDPNRGVEPAVEHHYG